MENSRARLLQRIGAVLSFPTIAVVDDEECEQYVDERLELEHVSLVYI